MKKWLAVIACGLLAVLALAACGAKDDSSAQNTLEASLVALSGDLLTVQGTDGSELVFSVKGVEIENAEAYKAGDAVTITYTGEVKGTDTSRAVVVSVPVSYTHLCTAGICHKGGRPPPDRYHPPRNRAKAACGCGAGARCGREACVCRRRRYRGRTVRTVL